MRTLRRQPPGATAQSPKEALDLGYRREWLWLTLEHMAGGRAHPSPLVAMVTPRRRSAPWVCGTYWSR